MFDLQMGKTPSRDNAAYWHDGIYKWVSIADIGQANKYITDTKETITQDAIKETGIKLVPKNTVIMSFKLSLGKTAITSQDMYTNEAIMAFHNKGIYSVDIDYLYHLFRWFPWGLNTNKAVMGATLNKATLFNIKIPLPPLDEQKRIAKNLDLASEIVKGYKEQLAELDKLVQSVFYEMFGDPVTNEKGWKISVFADICKVRQGLQIPISKRKKIPGDNRYVYITVQFLNGRKQTEYIENPKQTVVCNKDDVLMTRTGNTGMVVTDVEGVFHNNFFLIDFNRNILDKNYLVKYLTLDVIKTELLLRAGNSTIPDLNHSEFYKIKIPIPPIYLQTRFAAIVTEIEAQKAQIQQALSEAENLFNSLMQEYFE